MKKSVKHRLAAALLAAGLGLTGTAQAGALLSSATVITGTVDGSASALLGADQGYAAVSGSNTTHFSDSDFEYISADYGLQIDFLADGTLQFWDNSGSGVLGSASYVFELTGLGEALAGISLLELSAVSGGAITVTLLNDHSFSISLDELSLSEGFASFSLQLEATQELPEPASAALLAGALALLWAQRQRRR